MFIRSTGCLFVVVSLLLCVALCSSAIPEHKHTEYLRKGDKPDNIICDEGNLWDFNSTCVIRGSYTLEPNSELAIHGNGSLLLDSGRFTCPGGGCSVHLELENGLIRIANGAVLGGGVGTLFFTSKDFELMHDSLLDVSSSCSDLSQVNPSCLGCGGGHGGFGGGVLVDDGQIESRRGGLSFDDSVHPSRPGSAGRGKQSDEYGHGGGSISIQSKGYVLIEGKIHADGANGYLEGKQSIWGAGAGGGVRITGDNIYVSANAIVSASGGNGGFTQGYSSGGGGGGRVSLIGTSQLVAHEAAIIRATGGAGGSEGCNGGAGTVYLKDGNDAFLWIISNQSGISADTPYPPLSLTDVQLTGDLVLSTETLAATALNISSAQSISLSGSLAVILSGSNGKVVLNAPKVNLDIHGPFGVYSLDVNCDALTVGADAVIGDTNERVWSTTTLSDVRLSGRQWVLIDGSIMSKDILKVSTSYLGSIRIGAAASLLGNTISIVREIGGETVTTPRNSAPFLIEGSVRTYGGQTSSLRMSDSFALASITIRGPKSSETSHSHITYSGNLIDTGYGNLTLATKGGVVLEQVSIRGGDIRMTSIQNITIGAGSIISSSNLGPINGNPGCDNLAYGGSHSGSGSSCASTYSIPTALGSITKPDFPGNPGVQSCAAGSSVNSDAVGRGGGVIHLDARYISIGVAGVIEANGGDSIDVPFGAGGGSGGSIYMRFVDIVNSTTYTISANGGSSKSFDTLLAPGGGGSGGRISMSRLPSTFPTLSTSAGTVVAHGGIGTCGVIGAGGTIYSQTGSAVVISNLFDSPFFTDLTLTDPCSVSKLSIFAYGKGRVIGTLLSVCETVTIYTNGVLYTAKGIVSIKTKSLVFYTGSSLVASGSIHVLPSIQKDSIIDIFENSYISVADNIQASMSTLQIEGTLQVTKACNFTSAERVTFGPFSVIRTSSLHITGASMDVNGIISVTSRYCDVDDKIGLFANITETLIIRSLGYVQSGMIHLIGKKIVATGVVSSVGLGCGSGTGPGKGETIPNIPGGGGAHRGPGGMGRSSDGVAGGGEQYDSGVPPVCGGSGGGGSNSGGGDGGGVIRLECSDELVVDGVILADGDSADGSPGLSRRRIINSRIVTEDNDRSSYGRKENENGGGGGAGGAIYLSARRFSGSGLVSADGGDGIQGGGGGGGGLIYVNFLDQSPDADISFKGQYYILGGRGADEGDDGGSGLLDSSPCPLGRFGSSCAPCEVGTFSDEIGKPCDICMNAPSNSEYTTSGWATPVCPYDCLPGYVTSDCVGPLMHTWTLLGGPIFFAIGCSIMIAALLGAYYIIHKRRLQNHNMFKMQLLDSEGHTIHFKQSVHNDVIDPFTSHLPRGIYASDIRHHFCRIYLIGSNTPSDPWIVPNEIPLKEYSSLFNMEKYELFRADCNKLISWSNTEKIAYHIIKWIFPLQVLWLRRNRQKKVMALSDYCTQQGNSGFFDNFKIRSNMTSIQLGVCSAMAVGFFDIADENYNSNTDSASLPAHVALGGDGGYHSPFFVDTTDAIINSIAHVLPLDARDNWNRFIDGFNSKLRLVRKRHITRTIGKVLTYLIDQNQYFLEKHDLQCNLEVIRIFTEYKLALLIHKHKPVSISTSKTSEGGAEPDRKYRLSAGHVRLWEQYNGSIDPDGIREITLESHIVHFTNDAYLQQMNLYQSRFWGTLVYLLDELYYPVYDSISMTYRPAFTSILLSITDLIFTLYTVVYWVVVDDLSGYILILFLPFLLFAPPLLSLVYIYGNNHYWGRVATSANFLSLVNWITGAFILIVQSPERHRHDLRSISIPLCIFSKVILVHSVNLCLSREMDTKATAAPDTPNFRTLQKQTNALLPSNFDDADMQYNFVVAESNKLDGSTHTSSPRASTSSVNGVAISPPRKPSVRGVWPLQPLQIS